jgi:hypothetical protein
MSKFVNLLDELDTPKYDGRKITLSTKEGKPLRIQFPRMYMPFGISGFTPEVGATKWSLDFAMKGYDEDGNYVKKFYDTIHEFEDKIIEAVHEQSEDIFKRKVSKDELKSMFNSNIKESSDREPKFRVKVDTSMEGKLKAHVYDEHRNPLNDECVSGLYSRSSGTAIVEINSVYFLNKMFGVTYKLYQLVTYEPQTLKGFQFIVD